MGADTDLRSWLDRLVQGCVGLLVAALALYFTVQVLAAIWVWLVSGLIVTAGSGIAVLVIRRRLGGW